MEGVRVEITEEAFGAITKHIAIRKRGETGGILIGQYSPDHLTAKVLSASGPGKQSLLGLFSFTRRASGVQEELDKEFKQGRYYLGEWHCHPGRNHAPSPPRYSSDARHLKIVLLQLPGTHSARGRKR